MLTLVCTVTSTTAPANMNANVSARFISIACTVDCHTFACCKSSMQIGVLRYASSFNAALQACNATAPKASKPNQHADNI
jgi:hypothetical protein